MAKKVTFVDCSLRDGHQSLLATRMSTAQCLRVLPMLKTTGYPILELWGGATLDSALRFTNDDPFERLMAFRKCLGSGTQIRSLCRGQNLFGYTPYCDELVCEFIKEAVRQGNDRIRIFDALNDVRNLTTAIMSTKTFGGHAEAALSYTTSPVHDIPHFVRFAASALDDGADSLAIKDMAGLLHPADCFELVSALRKAVGDKVEMSIHSHTTNGLATITYLAAMIAGVNNFDTDHGPMAGSTAHPPVELMVWFAREMGVEHGLNTSEFGRIDAELRKIRVELKDFDKDPTRMGNPWPTDPPAETRKLLKQVIALVETRDRQKLSEAIAIVEDQIMVAQGYPPVDRSQLDAQVPGGMISNLHNQLKAVGKLENMALILDEIPRVRADAGYVPLVTPTSQIVGTQAAFNVNTGARYSIISEPFRDLVLGKYGRLPAPANQQLIEKCAPDGKTFSQRPARYAPEVDMAAVGRDMEGLIRSDRDILLYLLFPQPAKAFFQKRQA